MAIPLLFYIVGTVQCQQQHRIAIGVFINKIPAQFTYKKPLPYQCILKTPVVIPESAIGDRYLNE